MLPDLEGKEITLLNHIINNTKREKLIKIYGSKDNFNYHRRNLFEKLKITNNIEINYKKLGLDYYFVLSKNKLKSPYLTQCVEYYEYSTSAVFFLSRFCIPAIYEKKFLNLIESLDSNSVIYKAKEIAKPKYNFRPYRKESDEYGLWNFIKYYSDYELPTIQSLSSGLIKFNKQMLSFLHYLVEDIPKQTIYQKPGFSKQVYYKINKKLEKMLYKEKINIQSISKLLFILNNTGHAIESLEKLISAFLELFIYCHPYEISQVSYSRAIDIKNGLLCILTPPTINIPLFIDSFYEFFYKCEIYLLDENIKEYCNIYKAFDDSENDWEWNDDIISKI